MAITRLFQPGIGLGGPRLTAMLALALTVAPLAERHCPVLSSSLHQVPRVLKCY